MRITLQNHPPSKPEGTTRKNMSPGTRTHVSTQKMNASIPGRSRNFLVTWSSPFLSNSRLGREGVGVGERACISVSLRCKGPGVGDPVKPTMQVPSHSGCSLCQAGRVGGGGETGMALRSRGHLVAMAPHPHLLFRTPSFPQADQLQTLHTILSSVPPTGTRHPPSASWSSGNGHNQREFPATPMYRVTWSTKGISVPQIHSSLT